MTAAERQRLAGTAALATATVLSKGPSRELSGWMTQILFTFALVPSVIVV